MLSSALTLRTLTMLRNQWMLSVCLKHVINARSFLYGLPFVTGEECEATTSNIKVIITRCEIFYRPREITSRYRDKKSHPEVQLYFMHGYLWYLSASYIRRSLDVGKKQRGFLICDRKFLLLRLVDVNATVCATEIQSGGLEKKTNRIRLSG